MSHTQRAHRARSSALVAATALVGGLLGLATPAHAEQGEHAPLLYSTDPVAARFHATGRLVNPNGVHCTATVVAGEGKVRADAKALIVTNGHCVSDSMGTNEVRVDSSAEEGRANWRFTPAYFIDTKDEHRTFGVKQVRYATMKSVDVAVIELDTTYGELAKIDVEPMRLDAETPKSGSPVELVHAPLNGTPPGETYLRYSKCQVGAPTNVAEGQWLWHDSLPNNCKGIKGGSSGSPMVRADKDRIVALVNTTVERGYLGECMLGRPCEAKPDGVVAKEGMSYAIRVAPFAGCFVGGSFDLRAPRCQLDPGQRITTTDYTLATKSKVPQQDGGLAPARWKTELDGKGFTHAQAKVIPFGAGSCADPKGYGKVFSLQDRPVFDDPVPQRENFYVLCVVAGPSPKYGEGWQPHRFASMDGLRVDDTPPTVETKLDVWEMDEGWRVDPIFRPWEITGYEIKYGPRDKTDCADPEGYRPYFRIPTYLKKSEAPWRYCAVGLDHADNKTKPKVLDLG
ncbi:trypsin [Longimycelium tulufanense]|uniref:Trypsin n=1 Tax=Longimycelium tulufanense TaxID=907463 RepID=A0A8J3CCK5_9PSEU|nr:trypsin-like peptidase domain-containing protein [Longimycelium tulufanense]GGM47749.1 trypsin [Longimycelium tulufanense]